MDSGQVQPTKLEQSLAGEVARLKAEIAARDEEIHSLSAFHANVHIGVDHPTDFRYLADSRGNVVRFGANATELLGYSADELVGHNYLEWIDSKSRDSTRRFYERQFARRINVTYHEVDVVSKDGSVKRVGQNVSLLYFDEEIAGFQVLARVIQKSKDADALTSLSLPIQSRLPTHATDTPADSASESEQADLPNPSPLQLNSSDAPLISVAVNSEAVSHLSGADNLEAVNSEGDFSEAVNESSYRSLMGADAPVMLLARHEIEREKLYRQAIAAADGVMYQLDFRIGSYIFLDEGIERLIGYRPDEVKPGIWRQIAVIRHLRGEMTGLSLEEATERFRSGKIRVWSADYTVKTKQGERRCIADSSVILRDSRGEVYGCIGILQDITDRVLLQEQLLHSQKTDSLGRFAGGIAHDFNNLLTAILGYTSLASEDAEAGSSIASYLDNITYASERAADLTRQLLTFARKQVTQPTLIHLNDLIVETDQILRRLTRSDIEFTTILRPGLGMVRADRGQIQQVLVNLVVNARDAMPNGGRLSIETDSAFIDSRFAGENANNSVNPGEYVTLTVTDTGQGIDEIVQTHIFEPFFTTKDNNRGTGLGLATCDAIVRDNAGVVLVDSKPQVGTSFKVMLPKVEGTRTEAIAETLVNETNANEVIGTETILFVDDNELLRGFAVSALRGYGYHVLEASHPSAAIYTASNTTEEIPLLVTDIIMPEMNGVDLAEAIRKRRPEIRILYVSGYADSDVFNKSLLDSRSAFLQKPFTCAELGRNVRALLDRNSPRRDSGEQVEV